MERKAFTTARKNNEHLSEVSFDYAQFQQYSKRCEDLAIKHYKECWAVYPHTSEGRKSAGKQKEIAQKCIRCNPNDQKLWEIQELFQQAKDEMLGDTRAGLSLQAMKRMINFVNLFSNINFLQ